MILKKLGDEYKLYSHDSCIATTHESPYKKLSLKNCQAIENGYDLDELAYEYDLDTIENVYGQVKAFKAGFQKALELLGDNKELIIKLNDLLDGLNSFKYQVKASYLHFDCEEIIKSLQQNEWDVEIVMDFAIYPANLPKEGEERPAMTPKLDADGCLILRRC